MMSRPFFFLSVLAAASAVSSLAADTGWQRTTWNDEPAWQSEHGLQRVVVSEARSRVIYLGPADGQHNLLSAPTPREEPSAKQGAPNWGGHRFWLGPQTRWNWPPPRDWEFSAAVSATVEGDHLHLKEPQTDSAYPALERDYVWEGDRLRCTGRWQPKGRPYYGMHVVAVDVPAKIEARLYAWDNVPLGTVAVRGDTPNAKDPLPHPAVKVEGTRAIMTTGIEVAKLGFYPQTLSVERGDWTLFVHPGPVEGIALESPDYGYLSQVWVGNPSHTFCELEQISPFLLAGPDGWCSTTIYLEARPTK